MGPFSLFRSFGLGFVGCAGVHECHDLLESSSVIHRISESHYCLCVALLPDAGHWTLVTGHPTGQTTCVDIPIKSIGSWTSQARIIIARMAIAAVNTPNHLSWLTWTAFDEKTLRKMRFALFFL